MYNFISGTVADKTQNAIIIENGGIGYEIAVTSGTAFDTEIGDFIKLYTYLNVKEDAMNLFGFKVKAEKAMFMHLISISGIGPKVALSILGSVDLKELTVCIVSGNSSGLNRIKGVGKKTAERIIIELKDKIVCDYSDDEFKTAVPAVNDAKIDEAAMYLMAMGITKAEAVRRINAIYSDGMDTEQLVVAALAVK